MGPDIRGEPTRGGPHHAPLVAGNRRRPARCRLDGATALASAADESPRNRPRDPPPQLTPAALAGHPTFPDRKEPPLSSDVPSPSRRAAPTSVPAPSPPPAPLCPPAPSPPRAELEGRALAPAAGRQLARCFAPHGSPFAGLSTAALARLADNRPV